MAGPIYLKPRNLTKAVAVTLKLTEAESSLKGGNTTDKLGELLIQKESEGWKNVMTRLMNIILHPAEKNMAFRGSPTGCIHKIMENI
jgi:hypothetical protein